MELPRGSANGLFHRLWRSPGVLAAASEGCMTPPPTVPETPMQTSRTIVITGGTSGIGRAAALGFAKAGWQVAICGRRQDKLDSLKSEANIALAAACDVTDPDAV